MVDLVIYTTDKMAARRSAKKVKTLFKRKDLKGGVSERGRPATVKYNILAAPGFHGVSGYQNTGLAGNFQQQLHTPIERVVNVDPSTSSFGMQNRNPRPEPGRTTEPYNIPGSDYTQPGVNLGMNTMTPTSTDFQSSVVVSSLGLSRDVQAGLTERTPTYLGQAVADGFGQEDPVAQRLFYDHLDDADATPGDYTDVVNTRPVQVTPETGVRHGMFDGSGTQNPTYNINVQYPETQQESYNLRRIQQRTPALMNHSNATPATHPAHAQGIGPGHPNVSAGTFNSIGVITQQQSNPYPYLDLGMPPQPMEYLPGATGMLTDKAAFVSRSVPGTQIQFEL